MSSFLVVKIKTSSIWPIDRTLIRCYHSGPEWTWEQWQWRGTPHSPKLQHCWNLTIRLFSVISRTLVSGGLTPLQRCSQCILQPQLTGQSGFSLKVPLRLKLAYTILLSITFATMSQDSSDCFLNWTQFFSVLVGCLCLMAYQPSWVI